MILRFFLSCAIFFCHFLRAEPGTVQGFYMALQGNRHVYNVDIDSDSSPAVKLGLGGRHWGFGLDLGYHWVKDEFVWGAYGDFHYMFGEGARCTMTFKNAAGSAFAEIDGKHKRLWNLSLGGRIGYDGPGIFPYLLMGLRFCQDTLSYAQHAYPVHIPALNKYKGGSVCVPDLLWIWGLGIEMDINDGWFCALEADFGYSLGWWIATKEALNSADASINMRFGYHF